MGAEVSGLQLHSRQRRPSGAWRRRRSSGCRARVRQLTRRTRGVSLEQMVRELATYLTGWRGYFGYCETPSVLRALDSWIQRRLRCVIWKQWKRGTRRFAGLRARGVGRDLAAQTAGSPHGPWHLQPEPGAQLRVSLGLTFSRSACLALRRRRPLNFTEPPCADPHARWCDRGGGRPPPFHAVPPSTSLNGPGRPHPAVSARRNAGVAGACPSTIDLWGGPSIPFGQSEVT